MKDPLLSLSILKRYNLIHWEWLNFQARTPYDFVDKRTPKYIGCFSNHIISKVAVVSKLAHSNEEKKTLHSYKWDLCCGGSVFVHRGVRLQEKGFKGRWLGLAVHPFLSASLKVYHWAIYPAFLKPFLYRALPFWREGGPFLKTPWLIYTAP